MWTNILQYTIPAVSVIAMAYLLINKLLKNEENRRNFELMKLNQPIITPIKLRAYERLMLFLERITPNNMLPGKVQPTMSALEFQSVLMNDIKKEFEHNFAQQIYISSELWESIKNAEENIIQLINLCSAQCQAEDSAATLATLVIQVYNSKDVTAIDAAKEQLRNEIAKFTKDNA
ncbi:MAG: hypothetical protein QM751_15675 [Paludibacteraceae bacterium]